jgi:DNA-binding MarR family transcriptional regulator
LQRLRRSGLVGRHGFMENGKAVRHRLTLAGRRALHLAIRQEANSAEFLLAGIVPPKDRETLISALQRLSGLLPKASEVTP